MGCGAVPKDEVANSMQPLPKSNVNNRPINKGSTISNSKPQVKTNGAANSYNSYNNQMNSRNNNLNNNNGFQKVDIKYSNDYLDDKNKKSNGPVTQNKPKPAAAPISGAIVNSKNSNNVKNSSNDNKAKGKPNEIKKGAVNDGICFS